ncbi:MAG TPA: TspO/MBR family protein [Pseudonocardia sp.]|jgi:tryptophan-rich sensory protein|nr:TspO/MBR family protein [Pseudonocardia sp.]
MTGSLAYRRPGSPSAAVFALLAFIAVVAAVAVIGGLASASASGQYAGFVQPSWAPPAWLFGPAWTVLYLTIAVSGWLVWRRAGLTWPAHAVYAVQLVLNLAWSPLFFGAGWFGLAFAEIVLLWLSIVATIVLFARISRPAAWLLVPYLGWVTFAAGLNLAIWQLN